MRIAALLLLGAATGEAAVADVALTLALLAAFASIAFVKAASPGIKTEPVSPELYEDLRVKSLKSMGFMARA